MYSIRYLSAVCANMPSSGRKLHRIRVEVAGRSGEVQYNPQGFRSSKRNKQCKRRRVSVAFDDGSCQSPPLSALAGTDQHDAAVAEMDFGPDRQCSELSG